MRRFILATVAMAGLFAVTALNASAAPSAAAIEHRAPDRAPVTNVDYDHHYYQWHHHEWHHRSWDHGHWRYWD